jgi:hypothetical protein
MQHLVSSGTPVLYIGLTDLQNDYVNILKPKAYSMYHKV